MVVLLVVALRSCNHHAAFGASADETLLVRCCSNYIAAHGSRLMSATDDILSRLRARVAGARSGRLEAASTRDVADLERTVDLRLPTFYRRMLTEVANGGFGPGSGFIGIPPRGFVDPDLGVNLADAYLRGRREEDPLWRQPSGLLHLCSWGCAVFSYVDTSTPDAAVVTAEGTEQGLEHYETAPSLAGWITLWLSGVKLETTVQEVVGYREGLNPFTRKAQQYAVTRIAGKRLDLSARI